MRRCLHSASPKTKECLEVAAVAAKLASHSASLVIWIVSGQAAAVCLLTLMTGRIPSLAPWVIVVPVSENEESEDNAPVLVLVALVAGMVVVPLPTSPLTFSDSHTMNVICSMHWCAEQVTSLHARALEAVEVVVPASTCPSARSCYHVMIVI